MRLFIIKSADVICQLAFIMVMGAAVLAAIGAASESISIAVILLPLAVFVASVFSLFLLFCLIEIAVNSALTVQILNDIKQKLAQPTEFPALDPELSEQDRFFK